jgi:putative ABC transport system ATP-binding protein
MSETTQRPVVLEVRDLHKRYQLGQQSVHALAGVDLEIKKGEFLAIMGPSGSGKSTLLHLMGGLDRPTSGEVILGGQPLSPLDDDRITLIRRHDIGFVFQFFNLIPMLTAEENIVLPLMIDGQDVHQYQARLDSLLQLIGLNDRRNHKPDQLSGGEQQRVAIARALIAEPIILLADEPTGNLDSKNGAAIMSLLRRTQNELDQTAVIVTHDPRAAAYAGRLILLQDGIIIREIHFEPQTNLIQRQRDIVDAMEGLEA